MPVMSRAGLSGVNAGGHRACLMAATRSGWCGRCALPSAATVPRGRGLPVNGPAASRRGFPGGGDSREATWWLPLLADG
jgi:hypothetical protein